MSRTPYRPAYGRVFQATVPANPPWREYYVFPVAQDGTILELGDDVTRERFFRLSQGLVEGAVDLGARVLCKGCPHAMQQHTSGHVDGMEAPRGCTVPNCPCTHWEPSECRCYYGNGGNHAHPYRRWCASCKTRYQRDANGPYDDRAELTLQGPHLLRRQGGV